LLRNFPCCLPTDGFQCGAGLASDEPVEIKIGYLRQLPSKIRISLIDVAGGQRRTRWRPIGYRRRTMPPDAFSRQRYTLVERVLGEGDDPVAAMNALADQGVSLYRDQPRCGSAAEGRGRRSGARGKR